METFMETFAEIILIDNPCLAMCINDRIFRETVYGIVKRLCFFVEHIEAERQRMNVEPKEIHILDVGCGTGIQVTIPLANAGYSVVGIDSDRASIERARELSRGLANIELRNTEFDETQVSELFDLVICSEVLEHLANPEKLVWKMRNVLKERGFLLVTVPNGYGYFEGEKLIERLFPKLLYLTEKLEYHLTYKLGGERIRQRWAYETAPEHHQLLWPSLAPDQHHCQHFTPGRIQQVITSQGFEVIEFRNRTLLAGNILSNLVRDWDRFLRWNNSIVDKLPHWVCAGWMLAARRLD
jgi:2-polyprenyl-3-methyl-5-hydroxy-6-metoxy-1,4-benzoquinol methylase